MITIILGTRPEIIKMSPVIRACQAARVPFTILHTGQHYSYSMDKVFFEELGLPQPDAHIDAGSGTHGAQTARILEGVEEILMAVTPDIVLVQGDTNTVLAGALAAAKLHVPVGHVEAGLRSFDRRMPEEINRVVADHVSDLLFAPTDVSRGYLLQEGIPAGKIYVTGNTIVDAVFQNLALAGSRSDVFSRLDVEPGHYFLVTAHRAENVDDAEVLGNILTALCTIGHIHGMPVIYPIHPRTEKMIQEFGLSTEGIRVIPPLGYLDFLLLESKAALVLTDSGGLQEEACILQVPCVTLRTSTERPETITAGANVLAGVETDSITGCAAMMLEKKRDWENPYGDGKAGERIIRICQDILTE